MSAQVETHDALHKMLKREVLWWRLEVENALEEFTPQVRQLLLDALKVMEECVEGV